MPDPNALAFPTPALPGLSKRELIAAMTLQGLLADPRDGSLDDFVGLAVDYADALLAALSQNGGEA